MNSCALWALAMDPLLCFAAECLQFVAAGGLGANLVQRLLRESGPPALLIDVLLVSDQWVVKAWP
jgi:hypothetical protein